MFSKQSMYIKKKMCNVQQYFHEKDISIKILSILCMNGEAAAEGREACLCILIYFCC